MTSGSPYKTTYVDLNGAAAISLRNDFLNSIPEPSAVSSFPNWAGNAGLEGGDALPSAIPFRDGVPNLLKYAFHLNGSGPDASRLVPGSGVSGLPFFGLEDSGGGPVFRVEYLRRRNGGLAYTPKISPDLSPGSFVPMTGEETVTFINNQWERVSVKRPIDPQSDPRLFGVVQVELAE